MFLSLNLILGGFPFRGKVMCFLKILARKGWFPYDRGSQIADRNKVCDRLRSYGNQPLDRTWFYLLRSSAIAIAEVVSI